jgi:hypothetical protein
MAFIEILLAITVGGIWFWSQSSAKLIQLIMQNNVTVLPLWVFEKKFYTSFSIINFILLILQFGLPISLFFILSITTSLFVLFVAFLISIGFTMMFQVIAKGNPMLNYYLGAISSIIFIILLLANIN